MRTHFNLFSYSMRQASQVEKSIADREKATERQYSSLFENRVVQGLSLFLRLTGTLIFGLSLILDMVYLVKSTFASQGFYAFYWILTVVRLLMPVYFSLMEIAGRVWNQDVNRLKQAATVTEATQRRN